MAEDSDSFPHSSFELHRDINSSLGSWDLRDDDSLITDLMTTKHKAILSLPSRRKKARTDYFRTWASAVSTVWTDRRKS